jgi:hypothetical protein
MKKGQARLVADIFFFVAIIFLAVSIYFKSKGDIEKADSVFWIYSGLLLAALLVRLIGWLFPKFGIKPTREELEERYLGNKH